MDNHTIMRRLKAIEGECLDDEMAPAVWSTGGKLHVRVISTVRIWEEQQMYEGIPYPIHGKSRVLVQHLKDMGAVDKRTRWGRTYVLPDMSQTTAPDQG